VRPDATRHDPRPEYLRALVEQSGLSQVECARRIGLDPATLRKYLMPAGASSRLTADYRTQYALERLAQR
jgi:transcriptional regulator with XRE-family HTH domain